jgi:hypothetical protein
MSAEIIPFGKPQPAPVKRRGKVRDEGEVTIGDMRAALGRPPTASEILGVLDASQQRRARISEKVRFMFGAGLYEVHFSGDSVQCIVAIQYRITANGVQEMKRYNGHLLDLDLAMVEAAKSARASGRKDAEIRFREAALAAFHKRRAKLINEIEKIDATLASMHCH